MKILSAQQLRELEKFTMDLENIESIDLIERAASECLRYLPVYHNRSGKTVYVCGKGNNGSDGLAMARLEAMKQQEVLVIILEHAEQGSPDFGINLYRLQDQENATIIHVRDIDRMPEIPEDSVVVDAILGIGLSRPIADGLLADAVLWMNSLKNYVFSIDIPSGLFADDNSGNEQDHVVQADMTITFHCPKMSFMDPEWGNFVGNLRVVNIELAASEMDLQSDCEYVIPDDLKSSYKPRKKFSHKGTYGHALVVAGSRGKMGAAQLTAAGALRIGAGLVSAHVPLCGLDVMQLGVREAMCTVDSNQDFIIDLPDLSPFNAIGIGPGIGTEKDTANVLKRLLQDADARLVIDADALNILGMNKTWLSFIPKGSILTPHPREFERIAGSSTSLEERLNLQTEFSKKYGVIVVLKGAHTCTTTPSGQVFFNSSGNPAMATAGSGDVLTGVILGLLAQGYSPEVAAIMGVYLHGSAADLASIYRSANNIIASDILPLLNVAFEDLLGRMMYRKFLSMDEEDDSDF